MSTSTSSNSNSNAGAVKRGAFILFEGLDRSGKSTQCELLLKHLNSTNTHHPNQTPSSGQQHQQQQGAAAVHYRFPNRTTTIGQMINNYLTNASCELDDHTIHLLFSANRWESHRDIINTLNAGQHVICDRYIYSGVSFSAAKGLPIDWCYSCDIGLPAPDLIIYIDIDNDTAMKRGGYGEERYEKKEIQEKVRNVFDILITSSGGSGNGSGDGNWQRIDGAGSVEEVAKQVQTLAYKTIATVQAENKPIKSAEPIHFHTSTGSATSTDSTPSSTVAG